MPIYGTCGNCGKETINYVCPLCTLCKLNDMTELAESLTKLWTTLRTAARAVVEQVAVDDREGAGWHEVTLASVRQLDAASVVEVQKK